MLVTFRVKNIVSFCVKKLLHFALKSCYILRQKLLHFGLMLHFASKDVTFRVNVTFCVNCYILRRNRRCAPKGDFRIRDACTHNCEFLLCGKCATIGVVRQLRPCCRDRCTDATSDLIFSTMLPR